MKVWISSETATAQGDDGLDDILWKLYMQIEKKINHYLEEIGYKNDALEKLRVIVILRNDAVFNEIKKYNKRKKNTDIRLQIDYNSFKNGNEEERENLIYDVLLRSVNILEDKGIEDLEVVRDFIESCKY